MTEKETEGIALLQHYADDADGRVILAGLAESVQVANAFDQTRWVPTVRKSKGCTVNLRTGQIFALTLKRDDVQILLLPELLRDEEREALEEAAHGKYEPKHPSGSARYTLDLTAAGKLWGSIERAHHAVLQQRRHVSGAKNNPEADALIDYLRRELQLDLPYPDRELVGVNGKADPPPASLLDEYAASDAGRAILRATARSIEVANAESHAGWGTTVDKGGTYVALNVGNACAIRLHENRVRILLLPDRLDAEVRKALDDLARHTWDRPRIPGAHNYELDWQAAADIWGSLEDAHHAALMASTHRRNAYRRSHSNEVIDFLNRELGLALPYPGYRPNPDANGPRFQDLVKSLEARGLLLPTETVANYVLALQAKRFAILTGISGTGKTKIAISTARHFQTNIPSRRTRVPEDAIEIVVRPYHLKHGSAVLPVRFTSSVDLFANAKAGSNSVRIPVSYPGGDTIELSCWRDPNPGQNWTQLGFRGEFKDWFNSTLSAGDRMWLRFVEGLVPEDGRLEVGVAESEIAEEQSDNYRVVPVRPDWVDNRGLLGYLNPLTGQYSVTPFLSLLLNARDEDSRATAEGDDPLPYFVVLDEMNLARVEHYFSDFLSALESDEPIHLHDSRAIEEGRVESDFTVPRELSVPRNVFFTGTVNIDETTYMFSPKVLDRAFTIEFDRVDLEGYTDGVARSRSGELDLSAGKDGTLRFTPYEKPDRDHWLAFTEIAGGRYARILRELHAILEEEHRHFGYRVANEIARFVNLAREQSANGDEAAKAAFDLALLQKVLPKFHGTQQELESLLERMFNFAVHGGDRRRGDTSVSLDEWTIKDGHLTLNGRAPSPADVPEETSHRDADGSADENQGSESETDAGDGAVEGPDPEFPRTAAKIWRMLRRLRQRGFTAFIE